MECKLFNYADDNNLSHSNNDITMLMETVRNDLKKGVEWFHDNYMKANPSKFQLIIHGVKYNEDLNLCINDSYIIPQDTIKILGLALDDKLNFNTHVKNICKKASMQLNILKRLSKYLNESCRLCIYKSFIASTFEYAPVVWIFCGKTNSKKLEKLQERALRFIYKDKVCSYELLLQKSGFLSLESLRLKYLAVETFKCIKGYNPKYLNDLFKVKEPKYNLRDENLVVQERFNTSTFGFRSFTYYGSKLWNSLPIFIKSVDDLASFKLEIDHWLRTEDGMSFVIS